MLQEAYKTDEIAGYLRALQEQYKTAKAEAIKEFAERLKSLQIGLEISGESLYYIPIDCIDNLAKEMTEPVKLEHNSLCETDTYVNK